MPRPKSSLWRLIALFAVLSLVFAACGDDDDDETTSGEDTEETSEGSG